MRAGIPTLIEHGTSTGCVRRVPTLFIVDAQMLRPRAVKIEAKQRGREQEQLFRACRSTYSGRGSQEGEVRPLTRAAPNFPLETVAVGGAQQSVERRNR